MNAALDYIDKVQKRFKADHPEIYEQFLDILMEYRKAPSDIDSCAVTAHNRVKVLFADEPDLLEGFGQFLPEVTPKEKNARDEKDRQKNDNEPA